MTRWVREGKCKRECFANHEGMCRALIEVPVSGECPFRRTDITIDKQYAQIERYSSIKGINRG